jgi:sporulation protein YlmC with PRC-barrel domain
MELSYINLDRYEVLNFKNEKISMLKDIFFNPNNGELLALHLKNNLYLAPYDIIKWYKNTVIIKNKTSLKQNLNFINIAKENLSIKILNKKVLTEDEKFIGRVNDIYFDTDQNHISYLEVKYQVLKTITLKTLNIPLNDIISITKKAIIIKNPVNKQKVRIPKLIPATE